MSEIDEALMLELFDWSKAVPASWGNRPYSVQTADIPGEFWEIWRRHKESVKALGINIKRDDDGSWKATWWRDPSVANTAVQAAGYSPRASVVAGPYNIDTTHLRPYQIPAVATLMRAILANRHAVDASSPGLGKTYSAIATARNLGMNVGVVCPANVVTKWTDTMLDVFELEPEFVLSYDRIRSGKHDQFVSREDIKLRGKTRTNYEWHVVDKVLLIFDEIHVCSGHDTLNSRILYHAFNNPYVHLLGLSATIANSPLYLDTIGQMLRLHRGNNWWDWCLSKGARPGLYGGLQFNARPGSRAEQGLKEIHAQIFPSRGCRLRRAELADQLPKNDIIVEVVDPPDKLPAAVEKILKEVGEKELADIEKAEAKNQELSAFTVNIRERQRAEAHKLEFVFDLAMELLESGRSVVVFFNYTASIAAFKSMLPKDTWYREIVGGMGAKNRDAAIEAFQSNKVRLIIVQIAAGSASIDLHDVHGGHPRASIINPSYSPRELQQALGRIDRDGETDCVQYIVFSSDDVDKRAAKLVQAKLNNIALLNDGDLQGVVKLDL